MKKRHWTRPSYPQVVIVPIPFKFFKIIVKFLFYNGYIPKLIDFFILVKFLCNALHLLSLIIFRNTCGAPNNVRHTFVVCYKYDTEISSCFFSTRSKRLTMKIGNIFMFHTWAIVPFFVPISLFGNKIFAPMDRSARAFVLSCIPNNGLQDTELHSNLEAVKCLLDRYWRNTRLSYPLFAASPLWTATQATYLDTFIATSVLHYAPTCFVSFSTSFVIFPSTLGSS